MWLLWGLRTANQIDN